MDPITVVIFSLLTLIGIGAKQSAKDDLRENIEKYNFSLENAQKKLNKLNSLERQLLKRKYLSVSTLRPMLQVAYKAVGRTRYFNQTRGLCQRSVQLLHEKLKTIIQLPNTKVLDKTSSLALAGVFTIETAQLLDNLDIVDLEWTDATFNEVFFENGIGSLPEGISVLGDIGIADVFEIGLVGLSALRALSNICKANEYDRSGASFESARKEIDKTSQQLSKISPKLKQRIKMFEQAEVDSYKWCYIANLASHMGLMKKRKIKNHISKNLNDNVTKWWESQNVTDLAQSIGT